MTEQQFHASPESETLSRVKVIILNAEARAGQRIMRPRGRPVGS